MTSSTRPIIILANTPVTSRRQVIGLLTAGTLAHAMTFSAVAQSEAPASAAPDATRNADLEAARNAANDKLATLLRAGACVVLMRHATTVPGTGDPPGFKLGVCSTQRNLSDAGRLESQRIGEWFAGQKLKPRAVLTSAWCRCQDTAHLAFGRHSVWPVLNSTFNDRSLQPDQTRLMTQSMVRLPQGQFEVWVTHQVNITALTGQPVGMGEAVVLDRKGQVLGRPIWRP